MEILSRGMLEAIQKTWQKERNATMQESEAVMSTALALYDENEKMKAGIEKLREKWKVELDELKKREEWDEAAENIRYGKEDMLVDCLQDLATIGGKGEE